MTYGELKDRVLQLIFSYSIAGEEIEDSYNNQADYIAMIPGLLNSAQTYIYQIKRFRDSILLKDLAKEELDGMDLYVLPEDVLKIIPGLIMPRSGKRGKLFERFNDYRLFGGDKMMVPKGAAERYGLILEYEKRGVPVSPNVKDTYVLKNTDEVNELLPFYIAAFVVVHDDAFKYSVFYNEFETRLQRLSPNPTYIEENEVEDVYEGFDTTWW